MRYVDSSGIHQIWDVAYRFDVANLLCKSKGFCLVEEKFQSTLFP